MSFLCIDLLFLRLDLKIYDFSFLIFIFSSEWLT